MKLLQQEAYRKLLSLEARYYLLQKHLYPTRGCKRLTEVSLKFLEEIKKNFAKYSDSRLNALNINFFPYFSYLQNCMSQSKMQNIPWSILPSCNDIFCKIYPKAEFILYPSHENNYSITAESNPIEQLKGAAQVKGFLFDSDFVDNIEEFFLEFPSGIFLVSFPETERLSVLQFAILGHEIGHIFARDISNSKCLEEIYENLETKFLKLQKTDQFADFFTAEEHLGFCKNILKELISDIFGVLLFGPSFLIAFYIFFLGRIGESDNDSWKDGYLSPIYRLSIMEKTIKYILKKNDMPKIEDDCIDVVQKEVFNKYTYFPPENKYIQAFINFFNGKIDFFCDKIACKIGDEIFINHHNEVEIQTVIKLLRDSIPPCSSLDNSSLKESPINFRNILYGTCKCIFDNSVSTQSLDERVAFAKQINLLSLKAIEMSAEQERFQNVHAI